MFGVKRSCALLLVGLSAALLRAEPAVTPSVAKDYALFVGSTLMVETGGSFHEVLGTANGGASAQIVENGQRRRIDLADASNIRIDRGLKLSNAIAQISEVDGRCTKSGGGAPDWMQQMVLMNDLRSQAVQNENKALNAQAGYSSLGGGSSSGNDAPAQDAQKAGAQIASAAASSGAAQANSMANAASSISSTLATHEVGANAFEVRCNVSAPKPAEDAYLLLITEYREASGGDRQVRIHLEPVGKIGSKARSVTILQRGLPTDFQLEQYRLHLFAGGAELATNLSERRVDLTEDDALRYLSLSYIASHPKATLPAVPQRVAVPVGFKQTLAQSQLDAPIYATVGADGMVSRVSADERGESGLAPSIETVVKKFRFNPALKEGKPVESLVAFKLSEYLH